MTCFSKLVIIKSRRNVMNNKCKARRNKNNILFCIQTLQKIRK